MSSNRSTTAEDVAAELTRTMEAADQSQRAHLEESLLRQEAREGALRVERARLAARFGADHPRVRVAAERLDAQANLRHNLRAELERIGVPDPDPSDDACIFHGRVVDANGLGVAGLVVSALGANQNELAKARTEEAGRFALRVPAAQTERVLLAVSARGEQTLYRDKRPRQATPGGVFYTEITVDPSKKV